MYKYNEELIKKINKDIEGGFPHLFAVTEDMERTFEGVSRLVMLDRYTQKDLSLNTLSVGDLVISIVNFPFISLAVLPALWIFLIAEGTGS